MMKNLLKIFILLMATNPCFAQVTTRLFPSQAFPLQTGVIPNLLGIRLELGDWRIYAYETSGLRIGDTVRTIGDSRYVKVASQNVYSAGMGLTKTGSEPSATFAVDQSQVMMADRATDSIANINGRVNGKANKSTTITINGVAQDLSANRSWSVGTLTSESDPIWIAQKGSYSTTSVANGLYYPLSSNPSSYVTSSSLSSTLGGYATTGALTTGLSGKYNTPSGTVGQYIRGDGSLATLPTSTTYTAGSGIGITAGIISNLAPDQTVSITGGSGISVSGTYPNFTITNTYKPTINVAPARVLNTNFTASASRPTLGVYTVTLSTTNPLLIGSSSATVFAEYSTNGGSSWNAISSNASSNGVGITVTIQLTVGQVSTLVVPITEGWLVRLRTATTGTASVVLTEQKEINL